jgi:hypothetical protein
MGNFQPFARATQRDEDTYIGTQVGFVTYGSDDTYQVSYIELGARCDHIYDAMGNQSDRRKTTDVASFDDDLMRPDPIKEAVVADRVKRAETID